MSYESKLDRESGKLINPAQICLLLSIALHLLVLKFGLPTINFNNNSGRREVSVIELNPEQQARLPNLSPQLNTPDLPVPDVENLPPIDNSQPASPFAIPQDLIPGIGNPGDLPPLIIPPPPNFDNLPPITDITLPPIGDISDLPLPPEIPTSEVPQTPTDTTESETPVPPTTDKLQQPPTPTPETKPDTKPEPQTQPKLTPEQFKAQKVKQSQERIRQLRQSLQRNDDGTSDEEARKNYIAWIAKVKDVQPDTLEVRGTYPRDACIGRLKGASVYGVVVDSVGNVVALDLIKGSKYDVFDRAAGEEIINSALPNDTDKPKPYQVTVNYEYDAEICPSLTLPSIREEAAKEENTSTEEKDPLPGLQPKPEKPAPKPEPEPKPEPTPAPAPEPKPEPKPEPTPTPKPKPAPIPAPAPAPEPKPEPSLRDRLRDIPLPDRKPADLKNIPLPDKPNFQN